jgi:hypothetical protein
MISRNTISLSVMGLLFVFLGSFFVRLLLGSPVTGIDDADIFFVYGHNLAEGNGFVYNVGSEAVEGFTSFLWTLICALSFKFTGAPELLLFGLAVLLGAAAVGAALRRTESPYVFLLLMAAVPGWFAWCQVTLMETGLWCLVITWIGITLAQNRSVAVAALMPVMILTRPESMLWGGWVIFLLFLFADKGTRIKAAVPALMAYMCTLGGLIFFRLRYFGYPVPNTYYAKVSGSLFENLGSGFIYFFRYFVSHPFVLLLVGLVIVLTVRIVLTKKKEWSFAQKLALFILPGLGIPVLVGGDHFGAFRFYQPLWPLLCLIGACSWPLVQHRYKPRYINVALGVCLVGGWVLFPFSANLRHEFRIAQEGRTNGAALEQMFADLDELPTVATITAGGNKYGYSGHVYDLMGLNSTEMAHAPGGRGGYKNHAGFNREVFYGWEPDVLLCGDSEEFDTRVLGGLHEDSRFRISYIKCMLHRNGSELNAWFRNDFLMSLPGNGTPVIMD